MFGTVPCAFRIVAGDTYSYEAEKCKDVENTEEEREIAIRKYKPLTEEEYGEGYGGLQTPAMPTTRLEVEKSSTGVSSWPKLLQKPLLKVPLTSKHDLKGFACGVRSAIVKIDGEWFRLKGCGNNDIGFPIRVNKFNKEIRGCMFPDTAARELHMSNTVAKILKPVGFLGANEPLGWYAYEAFPQTLYLEKKGDPPKWTECKGEKYLLPKVVRCCGLFKINGDRRLDCHVLNGLELLLPRICDGMDMKEVLAAFPTDRMGLKESAPQPTGDLISYSFEITWHMSMFDKFPKAGQGDSSPLNALAGASKLRELLKERAPSFPSKSILPSGKGDEELWIAYDKCTPKNVELMHTKNPIGASDDAYPKTPDPAWAKLWTKCQKVLEEHYSKAPNATTAAALLPYIYYRFGYECGTIQRAMTDNGVSWGTYEDPLGYHCNAHANNLVLLAEDAKNHNGTFLAPLDLDMSFTQDNFIFSHYVMDGKKIKKAAKKDDGKWSTYLKQEVTGFLKTLSGDMGGSTGVTNVSPLPKNMLPLKIALRDVMAKAFWTAYSKEKPEIEVDPKLRAPAYALLKMALIMTSKCIA
mmetsp:Transcript_17939/g.29688  ORF Transcript_17939/g.29688 Transcript_17939/m.29688 type:complete len:581 (+) Transcript_17939:31-1773(+)